MSRAGAEGSPWVDDFERKPTAVATVYLVPHAGAGVAPVRRLNRIVSPSIDVRGICLPLREKRILEAFNGTLGELAADLASAICDDGARMGRSILLAGVCSGAWIAYATATRLRRCHARPGLSGLLVGAHDAGPGAGADAFDPETLGGFEAEISGNAEMMEILMERCRLDCDLAAQHIEAPPLDIPVNVIAGARDHFIDDQDLDDWAKMTSASCRIQSIAAGHHLLQEPDNQVFAEAIERWVRELALGAPLVSISAGRGGELDRHDANQQPRRLLDVKAAPLEGQARAVGRERETYDRSNAPGRSLSDRNAAIETAWKETLGLPGADSHVGFFDAGGDSMLAVRFVGQCRKAGVTLRIRDVLEATSLSDLLARSTEAIQDESPMSVEERQVRGLLPAECRWLAEAFDDPDLFNVGDVYAIGPEITDLRIAAAATKVAGRHDALRTRYPGQCSDSARIVDVEPEAIIAPPMRHIDPDDAEMVKAAIRQLQTTVSLAEGRVLRLCRLGPLGRPGLLVVIVHHMAIDGFGYALLVDELEAALAGEAEEPLAPTRPWEIVAALQRSFDDATVALNEAKRWVLAAGAPAAPLIARAPGSGRRPTTRTARSKVPLSALTEGARGTALERLSIKDRLLLATLFHTAYWAGREEIAADVYHHARDVTPDQLPLTLTIAYLQTTYPFALNLTGIGSLDRLVERFLERQTAVPPLRMGFDFLRFAGHENARKLLADQRKPDLGFNFRANYRSFAHAPRRHLQSRGELFVGARSPRQHEKYALLVEGDIAPDHLVVDIIFSTDHFQEADIQRLNEAICGYLAAPSF